MMNLLEDMTLRGSGVFLLVACLDLTLGKRVSGIARRLWWAMVPLAFLFPFRLPLNLGSDWSGIAPLFTGPGLSATANQILPEMPISPHIGSVGLFPWLTAIWLSGAFFYLLVVFVQTWRISCRWEGRRLCTDPYFLNLLEDCKKDLRIKAPIGLVLADEISTPAILGWLRPRILLPLGLAQSMSGNQLKAVLMHELSHFRWADIPFGWLLTLVRALHWFNPLAHLAALQWTKFREEAADECSLNAMPAALRETYGETLLQALQWTHKQPMPFGSLAIVESVSHLKKRIGRISSHQRNSHGFYFACTTVLLLSCVVVLQPARAASDQSTGQATQSMMGWLKGIDENAYAASWQQAAKSFQTALTEDQWITALKGVRTPLGSCLERKLVSAVYQTGIPVGNGKVLKGDFVIAQFETSFSNLKYAKETVTFEKDADGSWKASGYFIKPR